MTLIEQARELAKNPDDYTLMNGGWQQICDEIEKRALAARPRLKSFEVHHATETARKIFLAAYVEKKKLKDCIELAIAGCGL